MPGRKVFKSTLAAAWLFGALALGRLVHDYIPTGASPKKTSMKSAANFGISIASSAMDHSGGQGATEAAVAKATLSTNDIFACVLASAVGCSIAIAVSSLALNITGLHMHTRVDPVQQVAVQDRSQPLFVALRENAKATLHSGHFLQQDQIVKDAGTILQGVPSATASAMGNVVGAAALPVAIHGLSQGKKKIDSKATRPLSSSEQIGLLPADPLHAKDAAVHFHSEVPRSQSPQMTRALGSSLLLASPIPGNRLTKRDAVKAYSKLPRSQSVQVIRTPTSLVSANPATDNSLIKEDVVQIRSQLPGSKPDQMATTLSTAPIGSQVLASAGGPRFMPSNPAAARLWVQLFPKDRLDSQGRLVDSKVENRFVRDGAVHVPAAGNRLVTNGARSGSAAGTTPTAMSHQVAFAGMAPAAGISLNEFLMQDRRQEHRLHAKGASLDREIHREII